MRNETKCHVCKNRHGYEAHPAGVKCLTCGNVIAGKKTIHVDGGNGADPADLRENGNGKRKRK